MELEGLEQCEEEDKVSTCCDLFRKSKVKDVLSLSFFVYSRILVDIAGSWLLSPKNKLFKHLI